MTILKANDTFILFNPKFHQFLKIESCVNVQEQMIKIPEKLLKNKYILKKNCTTTTRFKSVLKELSLHPDSMVWLEQWDKEERMDP